MRNLTPTEQDIIKRLCAWLTAHEREGILLDLQGVQVTEEQGNPLVLKFHLKNYDRPKYKGQRPYSAEVKLNAVDGAEIYIILYKDQNNRLFELEYVRPDEKPLGDLRPDTMVRVFPFGEVIELNSGENRIIRDNPRK